MRKISFFNYISFFSASVICGAAASVGLIFLTKPLPAQVQNIPPISFKNVQLFDHNIETKGNPFEGPLVEVFSPTKKPAVPDVPKVPSGPGGKQVSEAERISVIGVMPPDTAIVRRGAELRTVMSGEKTAFGSIGAVTAEGVYVDGKFYKMGEGLK